MSEIYGTQFECDHCGELEFLSASAVATMGKPERWLQLEPSTEHPSEYGLFTHYCSDACKEEHDEGFVLDEGVTDDDRS